MISDITNTRMLMVTGILIRMTELTSDRLTLILQQVSH